MEFATAHELLVKVVSIMGLFGIPTLFAMATGFFRYCVKQARKMEILMKSQQEQMKCKLYEQYKFYKKQGWIEIEDLEIFESQYQAYHELGQNGVMDSKRAEILSLPNIKK